MAGWKLLSPVLRAEGPCVCPTGWVDEFKHTFRANGPAICLGSIPNVTLVDLDVVFLTNASILVLERHVRVVFHLIANVRVDRRHQRMADGKRAISRLPGKDRGSILVMLGPLRSLSLHLLDQLRNRDRSRKPQQQVHVVIIPTDRCTYAIRLFHLVGEHAEHFRTEGILLQKWSPIFGREDDV